MEFLDRVVKLKYQLCRIDSASPYLVCLLPVLGMTILLCRIVLGLTHTLLQRAPRNPQGLTRARVDALRFIPTDVSRLRNYVLPFFSFSRCACSA